MVPYIGITDFETLEQVQKMQKVFVETRGNTTHNLSVGVMMSYKTLRGIETKWQNVWPSKEKIADIFIRNEDVMNTLHYADYDNRTTLDDILEAVYAANRHDGLNAIQFDMPWPSHRMIAELPGRFEESTKRELEVIIQVGRVAIDECQGNMERVIDSMQWYVDHGACILFDMSAGKGVPLDANLLRKYLRLTVDRFGPQTGIAVAGGLGPKTMHLVEPLLGEFPYISIDAQGKLRTSGNALDPIDWNLAEEYIRKAVPMFL